MRHGSANCADPWHPFFERWAPAGAVLLLLGVSLVVVWGVRYLPMQDYPQNLFQAKLTGEVLSGHGVGVVEGEVYGVHVKATYSVFFLVVWVCEWVMPLWAAGKCAVSLYFVLTAAAAWRLMRFTGREGRPGWGALLLFPATFNPIYYLGFLHFLYAMPLLVMALLHLLETAESGWSARRVMVQGLWLGLLLCVHPFAVVMYGLAAGTWALLSVREGKRWRRLGVGLAMAAGVGGVWAVVGWLGKPGAVSGQGIYFQPMAKCAEFAVDLFVGLGGVGHPDWVSAALWCGCVGMVVWAGLQRGVVDRRLMRDAVAAAMVMFAGVCFLPFGTTNASYLNVRMALGVYLLLAMAAGVVRLSGWRVVAILCATVLLDANAFAAQRRISGEVAEIEPMVAAMEGGARVLPLLFDRDAAGTDGYFFSLHLNDHFYYQVEKGGVSPYLLEAPREGRAPVFFRTGMQPAAPRAYFPTDFRWETYGAGYRYFLVRGGNESVYRYMERGATLRISSGKWRLYERRMNGA
jgi:hypothetical protein